MRLVKAVKRTTYVRYLANELGIKQIYPTIVHEDNDAVIFFVGNYDKVRQTNHFIVKVRYLQQQEQLGVFQFLRVDSANNVSDMFTKPLGYVLFAKFRHILSMVTMSERTTATSADNG